MDRMTVTHARLAAPSFQSLRLQAEKEGKPFVAPKRGNRPLHRVIVVSDERGYQWVHFHIFGPSEINKAMDIVKQIDQQGYVDKRHWRYAHKEY